MVFQADIAFAIELLALAAGAALLMYSGKEGTHCPAFGKIVGYFTLIVALLTMLCTSYYTLRYWGDGFFRYPHMGMGHFEKWGRKGECPMMHEMMEHGMEKGPMMKGGERKKHMMEEMMEEREMAEPPEPGESPEKK